MAYEHSDWLFNRVVGRYSEEKGKKGGCTPLHFSKHPTQRRAPRDTYERVQESDPICSNCVV